jgi:hypothetical protein
LILESLDSFLKVRDYVILLDSLLLSLIDSKLKLLNVSLGLFQPILTIY